MLVKVGDWALVNEAKDLRHYLQKHANCVMQVREVSTWGQVKFWGSDEIFLGQDFTPLTIIEGLRCRKATSADIGSVVLFDDDGEFLYHVLTEVKEGRYFKGKRALDDAYVPIESDIVNGKYKLVEQYVSFPEVADLVDYLKPKQVDEATCVPTYQEVVSPSYGWSTSSPCSMFYLPSELSTRDYLNFGKSLVKEEKKMALLSLCSRGVRNAVWSAVDWVFVTPIKNTIGPVTKVTQYGLCYALIGAAVYAGYSAYSNPQMVFDYLVDVSPVEIKFKDSSAFDDRESPADTKE